jgi:hypothetical protein
MNPAKGYKTKPIGAFESGRVIKVAINPIALPTASPAGKPVFAISPNKPAIAPDAPPTIAEIIIVAAFITIPIKST